MEQGTESRSIPDTGARADVGAGRAHSLSAAEYQSYVRMHAAFQGMSVDEAQAQLSPSGHSSSQAGTHMPPSAELNIQARPNLSAPASAVDTERSYRRGPLETPMRSIGTVVKLRGAENWGTWKGAVLLLIQNVAFAEETLLGEITASDPEYSYELDVALGTLVWQSLSEPVAASITSFVTGKTREKRGSAIYDKLRSPIERTDEASQNQVTRDLMTIKQNGETCAKLIARLDGLYTRAYGAEMILTDGRKRVYLLDALDAKYGPFVSTQHSMDSGVTGRTFESVVQALITEETRLHGVEAAAQHATALAVFQNQKPARAKDNKKGKYGQNSQKKSPNNDVKCFRCDIKGHRVADCPYPPPSGESGQ
ncbi:hypothetical protein CF335_g7275 [Tilletia laevis]|nr:hypothetical protein CF335_g7275 [Tilletia laevis]